MADCLVYWKDCAAERPLFAIKKMYGSLLQRFSSPLKKARRTSWWPISVGKQLNDLPDDVVTKVTRFYYSVPRLTRRPTELADEN